MRIAPTVREFFGPRPRQLAKFSIPRSSTHESEAADQQTAIIIKAVLCTGDTIDEIQAPRNRCVDPAWYFDHHHSSSRRATKRNEVIDTSKQKLYTVPLAQD